MDVSATIITDGRRILCFKKGNTEYDYLSEHFEFPGGKIESGETPEQALARELREELGYSIPNKIELFDVVNYEYDDFSVRLHCFIITDAYPEYQLTEHTDALWLPVEDLADLNWAGADAIVVERLTQRFEPDREKP